MHLVFCFVLNECGFEKAFSLCFFTAVAVALLLLCGGVFFVFCPLTSRPLVCYKLNCNESVCACCHPIYLSILDSSLPLSVYIRGCISRDWSHRQAEVTLKNFVACLACYKVVIGPCFFLFYPFSWCFFFFSFLLPTVFDRQGEGVKKMVARAIINQKVCYHHQQTGLR